MNSRSTDLYDDNNVERGVVRTKPSTASHLLTPTSIENLFLPVNHKPGVSSK